MVIHLSHADLPQKCSEDVKSELRFLRVLCLFTANLL
jgi:hypothetical protein